jgi:transposase, IS5 family
MVRQPGFFDVDERYRALTAAGDPLERLAAAVDFELFRAELEAALPRSDRSKGGRPPYDAVLMFKVLVLQTLYTLSDEQTEYQLKDRLSFMRFVGLALHEPVPDATTVWLFREQLVQAGAIERLFARFDAALRERGWLAMGGQIIDATVVQARPARLTAEEKAAVRRGEEPAGWSPARKAQIDRDARWTLKRGRKRPPAEDSKSKRRAVAIAVPVFGYKSHLGIDRVHGLIRTWTVTHAAAHEGGQLGCLLDSANTASGVWADTAYRSAANLELLARRGRIGHLQRKKPRGRPMPRHVARGNARRGRVRAAVEHVFAAQKRRLGLIIRTVGIARAKAKIGLANLTYNLTRFAWLEGRAVPA